MKTDIIIAIILCAFAFGVAIFANQTIAAEEQRHELHDMDDAAHWYESECCNQKDCRSLRAWGDKLGYSEGPEGVVVTLGRHTWRLKWDDERLRVSKDDEVHVCVHEETYEDSTELLCVYRNEGWT